MAVQRSSAPRRAGASATRASSTESSPVRFGSSCVKIRAFGESSRSPLRSEMAMRTTAAPGTSRENAITSTGPDGRAASGQMISASTRRIGPTAGVAEKSPRADVPASTRSRTRSSLPRTEARSTPSASSPGPGEALESRTASLAGSSPGSPENCRATSARATIARIRGRRCFVFMGSRAWFGGGAPAGIRLGCRALVLPYLRGIGSRRLTIPGSVLPSDAQGAHAPATRGAGRSGRGGGDGRWRGKGTRRGPARIRSAQDRARGGRRGGRGTCRATGRNPARARRRVLPR